MTERKKLDPVDRMKAELNFLNWTDACETAMDLIEAHSPPDLQIVLVGISPVAGKLSAVAMVGRVGPRVVIDALEDYERRVAAGEGFVRASDIRKTDRSS